MSGYKHGRVPREVRSRQLLDLAEQLFIEHGYAGFSIEDLCRAAGVTRPVVYEHFGSKDGLHVACLRRIRDGFEQSLADAAAGATTLDETLERGAEAFFALLQANPQRWSLVYGGTNGLVGPLADELADLRAHTVERIAAMIAPYKPGVEPERLLACAHAISGAGEQLGRWWLRNPKVPRKRVVGYHRDFSVAAAGALSPDRHARGRARR